jgi:hypothetical protein
MLSFWKRLRADTRWVRKLLGLGDIEVRRLTGPAVIAARDGDPIEAASMSWSLNLPTSPHSSGT